MIEIDFEEDRKVEEVFIVEGYKVAFLRLESCLAYATQWEIEDLYAELSSSRNFRMPDEFYTDLKDQEKLIFIDIDFWNASSLIKREFVLLHELGHLAHDHPGQALKLAIDNGWKDNEEFLSNAYQTGGIGWEFEREANDYARSRLGWTITELELFLLHV